MTQVGCAVDPPITGQLTLEGIPILDLVDTGASVTCLRFSVWWRYHAQWGPLKLFEGTVHGAHGKPLQIAGKTPHLDLQCGEARGRACFIVIMGLESPPCLIGMDIMRPLCVRIDVTNGTVTPAQPDPQTIHLNADEKTVAKRRSTGISPRGKLSANCATSNLLAGDCSAVCYPSHREPCSAAPNRGNPNRNGPSRLLPQPVAHRGRLFLSGGCSTGVCDWNPRALQWSLAMDCHPQSPARASPPAL